MSIIVLTQKKEEKIMKIAVLGSGNGGCTLAADWALSEHEVNMFDFKEFPKNLDGIREKGGITLEGAIEGFGKIAYAGHDIEKVLEGADLVFVVGPAFSTEAFGKACKPFVKKGQIFIVCPGSCGGSMIFKKAIGKKVEDDDVIVAETSTLPYACRAIEPGRVKVFLKLRAGYHIAAQPSKYTEKVYKLLSTTLYPNIVCGKNILHTTLLNDNPVIHPAVTLMNVGLIERTQGDFYFYEEGVTPAVGRLMEAVDNERIALGKKMGIHLISVPESDFKQGYLEEADYENGYQKGEAFKGIKAQPQLDQRYMLEDVGYGLVFMSELGKQIGVETPIMDSIINIASVLLKIDFRKEKVRTMESMMLSKYSLDELNDVL